MSHLYYLVGPPAVGKLSVARELEAQTGAIVVDNHLWNDPAFIPYGVHLGAPPFEMDDQRHRIMDIVWEAAELAPARFSHVFTHWLSADDGALLDRVRGLARRRGATFVPVWLTASEDALLTRVSSPDRIRRTKLSDPAVLREVLTEPTLPPPPDALVIDTTNLAPAETAARIARHAASTDETRADNR